MHRPRGHCGPGGELTIECDPPRLRSAGGFAPWPALLCRLPAQLSELTAPTVQPPPRLGLPPGYRLRIHCGMAELTRLATLSAEAFTPVTPLTRATSSLT